MHLCKPCVHEIHKILLLLASMAKENITLFFGAITSMRSLQEQELTGKAFAQNITSGILKQNTQTLCKMHRDITALGRADAETFNADCRGLNVVFDNLGFCSNKVPGHEHFARKALIPPHRRYVECKVQYLHSTQQYSA